MPCNLKFAAVTRRMPRNCYILASGNILTTSLDSAMPIFKKESNEVANYDVFSSFVHYTNRKCAIVIVYLT